MSNQPTNQPNGMPEQVLSTMPPGSKGPMDAGIKMQQQQTAEHMALIGKTGGSKRKMRGGTTTPVATVPPVSSSAVNKGETQANFTDLTNLALQQQTGATFDNAKTPSDTAALQAQQQAVYSGTGGSYKKGGSWPVWGCLSGGKQYRKSRKSRKGKRKVVRKSRKSRKSRKTKSHRM